MVIALLTDFGNGDYFAGAMRGVILSVNPNVKIADITHEIPPQNIRSASFTLRACYRDFPKHTIFLSVVDPGVGSQRRAILVETEDHFFIAPDNGLLSFVFLENEIYTVFEITNEKYFNPPVSTTFHGRDIFAPCAAHLSNGIEPAEFGVEIKDFVRFEEQQPRKIDDQTIEAEIIHIDRFGNLITNLREENLSGKFILEINGRRIEKFVRYFAECGEGELAMILGSASFLEIAAFRNSAEKILKAETGQKIKLFRID